ncbi:MAG TPA: hypothetical protein VG676_06540 [Chitinophagaceae bacterium]|nr:hypothetical protein [Chitinophagaceae bacterium]
MKSNAKDLRQRLSAVVGISNARLRVFTHRGVLFIHGYEVGRRVSGILLFYSLHIMLLSATRRVCQINAG